MSKISTGYLQLGKIFEALEEAKFEADTDFGAKSELPFTWFLSPRARDFLEKKHQAEWLFLKYNQQFSWKQEKWAGLAGYGISIRLIV